MVKAGGAVKRRRSSHIDRRRKRSIPSTRPRSAEYPVVRESDKRQKTGSARSLSSTPRSARGERVRDVPRLNEQSRRLAIASFYIETLEAPPREEWSGADGCRRVRGSSRTPTNSLSRSRRSVVRMEPWSLGLAAGADTVRRLPSIAVSNAEVGIASRAPAKRMKPAVGGSIQAHWHCATSSRADPWPAILAILFCPRIDEYFSNLINSFCTCHPIYMPKACAEFRVDLRRMQNKLIYFAHTTSTTVV